MRDRSENKVKIVFIRHGATKSNLEKRYVGRNNDESLSDEGKAELLEKKEKNVYPQGDIYFSSTKKRCTESIETIYPDVKYETVEGMEEIDFGEFEGKNYLELEYDERYIKWIESNGEIAFPGGESREEFIERSVAAFEKTFDKVNAYINFNRDKKEICIVYLVHGGTIMSVVSEYADMDYYDCMVQNGGGFICEADTDGELSLKILEKI